MSKKILVITPNTNYNSSVIPKIQEVSLSKGHTVEVVNTVKGSTVIDKMLAIEYDYFVLIGELIQSTDLSILSAVKDIQSLKQQSQKIITLGFMPENKLEAHPDVYLRLPVHPREIFDHIK